MRKLHQASKGCMLAFLVLLASVLHAQTYHDHFGTGNTVGVSVTTSHSQVNNSGANTLNGTDLRPDLIGASRFLSQASLGANYEEIEHVADIGIDAWLDEQFAMPPSSYSQTYRDFYDATLADIAAVHGWENVDSSRRGQFLSFTFYEKVLKDPDLLRQKVALALSQIFVVSLQNATLDDRGFCMSSYYDVLYQNAFGNMHDLLTAITYHPAMGIYLSYFQNRKANASLGTLPDENYAREVMQLFTIGLHELNNDGTYRTDESGNLIPTYDIVDVQELAKVFTGLSGGDWDLLNRPQNAGSPLVFHRGLNHYDLTHPMAMYEEHHETGEKVMLDGTVIPAGQAGVDDIADALEVLFNHPNVAPFIATRLIQHLVKSNPTPAYVNRVAMVFNNNGQGVRGDLEAVIRTILTDPEAINCSWIDHVKSGKLIQPIERLITLFRAFDITSPSGKLWFRDTNLIYAEVEQAFLTAPTVFNFFSPFYAEEAHVAPNNMVSPEFQIVHATSGIHYINLIENSIKLYPFDNRTAVNPNIPRLRVDNSDRPYLDLSDEIAIYDAEGLDALIERINLIICRGQLSDEVRFIITDAVNQVLATGATVSSENLVREILYFVMMSPDYVIAK